MFWITFSNNFSPMKTSPWADIADDFGAGLGGERGRDRAVDAAGHGNDDSGVARRAAKLEVGQHLRVSCTALYPNFTPLA